jgi:hypothetical protein
MTSVCEEILYKSSNNMETFEDLFEFLQNYKGDIIEWLKNEPWEGKDKQESLLRLFSGLGLIDKLKSYEVCKGNFNKKTIIKNVNIKDLFYNKKGQCTKLKDTGDSSDLTCISKNDNKHLLLTTSKNINKLQVGKLDIDKILTNFQQYEDEYTMSLCVCIRYFDTYQTMKKNIKDSSKELRKLLDKECTIIIDWNDLKQAFYQFKMFFGNMLLSNIIDSNKSTLCLKMHQHLGVTKTLRMKASSGTKKILWGHIQRSGKSYIIGGCIIEDSRNKNVCNYLVITTAPNETIEQQSKVFDCIQLNDFNIVVLNGQNKEPKLKYKNIFICSKQFLQTKIDEKKYSSKEKPKSITWLKNIKFDMRFIDESHNGGTTELAQKTLDFYGKNSFTVQITATYSKPINDYNISKDCWILWDLEDIKLCKNINFSLESINKNGDSKIFININKLVEKHGVKIRSIIEKYPLENIVNEYSKYPELWLLTDEINPSTVSEILNSTQYNNYGWTPETCFLLKQCVKKDESSNCKVSTDEEDESDDVGVFRKDEFQNEEENLKIWYRIFGKRGKFGIPEKEYPDKIVFMKRIEKICKNPMIDSRFIGDGDFHNEPMIVLAFLPQNNIDKISKATINLLEKHKVIEDYIIIAINSKNAGDPKQKIENARNKARNTHNKKGVLVLSGRQCSLGVSIENCDIVLLLNSSTSFDLVYQMMFRCMTEGKKKTCGFVVDLNIHRVIESSVINYASLIKPDLHPRESTKYILQERLINLNGDHWMPSFGNHNLKINSLCENVYNLYASNTENALNHFLNRLRFKEVLLTKDEQKIFNIMFNNGSGEVTKQQKEFIDKLVEDDEDEKIKKGVEKTKVESDDEGADGEEKTKAEDVSEETESDEGVEDKKINYMDILKHIIPLICLLTIHDKETSFIEMFDFIESDKYIYNILIDQTKSWWGKSIDSKIIKKFIDIYIKYMKDDKETNQIIRTVKELFMKNVNNSQSLGQLIDKYLVPQELEKKSNAEVSTPYKLRQEMLDKIPKEFWSEYYVINGETGKWKTCYPKVFEPCSGKGGFVIDIIERFMNGLKENIPDEKLRYKTIVEECIYFSDINPTNIFICKLLIDPYNEYKLNYNEGNTLELDITETTKCWKGVEDFDAVIGNPPYSTDPSKQNTTPLYNIFTEKFIDKTTYLLYVIPSRWFIGGKGLDKFRDMMRNRKDIKFIYQEDDEKKWFGNYVEIKGGVNYFLKDKNYNGKCTFNGELYDLSKYDIIIKPQYHNIIEKIKNNKCLDLIYNSSGYFKVRTNDKRLKDIGKVKCYVSFLKSKNRYKFIDNYDNSNNFWKVITSRAAFGAYSGFGYKQISNVNEIYTDSYISFKVNNEYEGNSLVSYLNTKFANYILSIRKISQDISENTCKWIPLLPLDRVWNDDLVYDYLNLTEIEINIIRNSNVKY